MYRFFVKKDQIQEDAVIIIGSDVNHIKNVLRMKKGETILISDGEDREYVCTIDELENEQVRAKIEDVNGVAKELPIKVTLFQALPKGDKMETVIQKMIELGAYEIVPVSTKRCIVKLDNKKAVSKTKRWNSIAESAAKQSKRGIIPKVSMPVTYKEALKMAEAMDMVLIPYENAENMAHTRQVVSRIKQGMTVGIFIGPEGGIEENEILKLKEIGAHIVTLGNRILRTETAGFTAASLIQYELGDLGGII